MRNLAFSATFVAFGAVLAPTARAQGPTKVDAAAGSELATDVVFGDDFAFSIEAPPGWAFAPPEAGRVGSRCTPTAAGASGGAAITAEPLKLVKSKTSRELTDAETATQRAVKPATRVRFGDTLEVAGQSVVFAKFTPPEGDAGAVWTTTAFLVTKTGGVRFALTAPTRAAHDASYQAFRNVVRGWRALPQPASH